MRRNVQFSTKVLNVQRLLYYSGETKLGKHLMISKKKLSLVTIALLLLSVTASTVAMAPAALASETCTITLTPNTGTVGTAVNVIGFGFVANAAVTLKFSGTQVKQAVSSSTGTITTAFFVPNMNLGTYTVVASDGVVSAAQSFTVQPQADQTVQLIPSLGKVGSTVKVIGYGFNVGSQISVKFGGTEILRDVSNASGSVTLSFTVPTMAAGTYSVSVTDKAGNTAASNYQITSAPQGGGTSQPTASSGPSSTPYYPPITTTPGGYNYTPIPKNNDQGVLSPLVIGLIIAAIIALIIPVTFFVRRRGGGRELTYEEEKETAPISAPPSYQPRSPAYPAAPAAAASRTSISTRFDMFDQPGARSPAAARYGQTPTYGQSVAKPYGAATSSRPGVSSRVGSPSAAATKTCPRCRQTIRADYSVCPHCNKRLR